MKCLSDGRLSNWRTYLAYAVMAKPIMIHCSMGYSLSMMMYVWEALVIQEVRCYHYVTWEDYNKAVAEHTRLIWKAHATAWDWMTRGQVGQRAKLFAQNQLRMNTEFPNGDLVWYNTCWLVKRTCRGHQRCIGPFWIAAVTPGPNFT